MAQKIRVLITKSDSDAHDRGPRFIASVLRDAGMEVIITRYRLPPEVIATAMQEDVDVIGLGFYMGGYIGDTSEIINLLKEKRMDNILVIIGGIIPEEDITKLLEMGVGRVFTPGVPSSEVVEYVKAVKGRSS